MKMMRMKRYGLWLTIILCLVLGLCLFVGCTPEGGDTETDPDTTAAGDTPTEESTTPEETPTDEDTAGDATDEPATEAPTEELKIWEQDTGKFNDGVVVYDKLVETEVHAAYPDDKVGQLMEPGQEGVINTFHADFSDNDPTCGGNATVRTAGVTDCRDGVLYSPFDANSATLTGDAWTTWGPNPSSSVKDYKQAQLSLDWSIVSGGDGAWLNAVWGCYVSNYTGKIPDGPGDGLWISFNPSGSRIQIYHPDDASWPAAWASVDLEEGMLSGKHHVDIITSPDYSTYIYVTPEGTDTARLVCTVFFADGKIRVYNEANEMVAESNCSTNALQGERYSLFVHGGGGAQIDNLDLFAASKGEIVTTTTVTATPAEGHSLGLDVTDKTDLVSICYSIWFDYILGKSDTGVDYYNDISQILAGNREWGGSPAFHYWAKPALGYYCSSNREVIRTHMTQLYAAGVDFIILDHTNLRYVTIENPVDKALMVDAPMIALFETIMEMRAEGLGTPYVVAWVGGDGDKRLYDYLYDNFYGQEKWADCFVYWDGKPFLLTTTIHDESNPAPEQYTTRCMGGLLGKTPCKNGLWNFLTINNATYCTTDSNGIAEQIPVCVASQETYMSADTAHGRIGGLLWHAQWNSAFNFRPKFVTLTWWNEWTAQRLFIQGGPYDGQYHFTDAYSPEYSRDIEPMEGGHGDQYYRWMIEYIYAYKNHWECPVLVEEEYMQFYDTFMKKYEKGTSLRKSELKTP